MSTTPQVYELKDVDNVDPDVLSLTVKSVLDEEYGEDEDYSWEGIHSESNVSRSGPESLVTAHYRNSKGARCVNLGYVEDGEFVPVQDWLEGITE